MGIGVVGCISFLIFLIPIAIFGQEASSYYFEEKPLYDNFVKGEQFEVSADKFIYKQGEMIKIYGHVYVSTKQFIYLEFFDAAGEKKFVINTMPAQGKNFEVVIEIPETLPDGRYTIVSTYGGQGIPISLDIVVDRKQDFITIPFGSFNKNNNLSFDPINYVTKIDIPIRWMNEDVTIHRIVEGEPKFFIDTQDTSELPLFDSGFLTPGEIFEVSLPEGEYQYYCTIHPWTVGQINVNSLDDSIDEKSVSGQQKSFVKDELMVKTNSEIYNISDTIKISGKIKYFEPNSKVVIQVSDDAGNLLAVSQIDPIQDAICCNENSDKKKILADDYISGWLTPWKKTKSITLAKSDIGYYKVGENALNIKLDTTDGPATVFHDYGESSLQDWSNYDYLSFWVKGQNLKDSVGVILRDESWTKTGKYMIIGDSFEWKQVVIPLKSDYPTLDLTQVRAFEISFNEGVKDGEVVIDYIELLQLVKERSGTFDYTISNLEDILVKDGIYKITALYGEKDYNAETFFTLRKPTLVEPNYEGFNIYRVADNYYAIPKIEGDLDMMRMKNNDYSSVLISQSIEELKAILTPLNVPQRVLLEIWNERGDLQKLYPEVLQGDISRLREWAMTTGWNEEYRLDALTPMDKIPMYELKTGKKVLVKEGIADWLTPWKQTKSITLALSNTYDSKEGVNSLQIILDTTDGPAAVFHDYGESSLQDWSNYDYLSFWVKGQNLKDSVGVILRDESWTKTGKYMIIGDSFEWKQVVIPLKSDYPTLDLTQVRAFEISFNEGVTQGKVLVDDVELFQELSSETIPYFSNEILLVVWQEESQLQSEFPEVKQGRFENLKAWAISNNMWAEDQFRFESFPKKEETVTLESSLPLDSERLRPLPGMSDSDDLIPLLQLIVVLITVGIGILYGYKKYKDHKIYNQKSLDKNIYSY